MATISNLKFIIAQYQRIMDNTKRKDIFMWALKEQAHYKKMLAKISGSSSLKTAERSNYDR